MLNYYSSYILEKEHPDTAFILNFSRLTPAQVYEEYKEVPGKEMNTVLLENKAALKRKKQQARDLAIEINKTKQIIDNNIADMKAKCSYFNEDFGKLETEILDEDVYNTLQETNKQKKRYRDLMQEYQLLSKDVAQCNHLVNECRKRLVSEFREWFDAVGGNMDELDSIKLEEIPDRDSHSANVTLTPIREMEAEQFYSARASMIKHRRSVSLDRARTGSALGALSSANRRRNIMFK
jgi:archaellum component FlaC